MRYVCIDCSQPWLPISGYRNAPFVLAKGGKFSCKSASAFRNKRVGQSGSSCICCFTSAFSLKYSLSLSAYFGVACSATFQNSGLKKMLSKGVQIQRNTLISSLLFCSLTSPSWFSHFLFQFWSSDATTLTSAKRSHQDILTKSIMETIRRTQVMPGQVVKVKVERVLRMTIVRQFLSPLLSQQGLLPKSTPVTEKIC